MLWPNLLQFCGQLCTAVHDPLGHKESYRQNSGRAFKVIEIILPFDWGERVFLLVTFSAGGHQIAFG